MKFSYGSFVHRENEAKLMGYFVRPRINQRGRRVSSIHEMHIEVQLILPVDQAPWSTAAAQAWLNTEIGKVVDAYYINGLDAVFMHDDGTPTRHTMISNQSISGVTVHHKTWPRGDGAEYATTRTCYAVFKAEYVEQDSPLWSYQEVVTNISTGGPIWQYQVREFGDPLRYQLAQRTPQQVIQTGRAVGVLGYPLGYMLPLYPPEMEHLDRRVVAPGSPQFMGNGYMLYPINWAFSFTLPIATNNFPVII